MHLALTQLKRRAITMSAGTALTLIACAGLTLPGTAAAATHAGRRIGATPVNPATISSDLKQRTGYSASQLTTRAACGAAQAGAMSCLARVLTVKSTGRTATLLHAPHATPTHVTQAGTDHPALKSAALGTTAPTAGTAEFLQWAYDTTWLSRQPSLSDTVAIIDAYDDPNAATDLAAFRSANGLPACAVSTCFNQYNEDGQQIHQTGDSGGVPPTDLTGGWEVEESLDIDAVSSLCPYCKIDLIEATNSHTASLEAAVAAAHSPLGANQISMSFGGDSAPGSLPENHKWAFSDTASLAAAGDDSYQGPDVAYPAAYPDVTAVGGTSLDQDATVARGFDESAWSITTCSDGLACGTESGCDTSQAVPSYQSGVDTECDGRAYNDISADGDPNTGLNVYDSFGAPNGGSDGCSGWCIVGGTSLATPLTAAFEAVTSVTGAASPAWTYGSDASLLNDIVSGSDGSCPSNALLICNAAPGWDGPTGNGSINGDVADGGPGVGGSEATGVNLDEMTFSGGVYPNGNATSYYWQYWQNGNTPASGTATPTSTASGQAMQAVSTTLCGDGLSPGTQYDYSLVATNTSGTEDGYEGTFTTPTTESAPTMSTNPTVSGSPTTGQTLTAEPGTWNDQSCNSTPSYQWQESSSPSGPWTTVSTSLLTYPLTSADLGDYLRFASTESNQTGSATVTSQVSGPVAVPTPTTTTTTTTTTPTTPPTTTPTTTTSTAVTQPPARMVTPPTFQGSTVAGSTIAVNPGVYEYSTATIVQFYRCARGCTLLNTHGAWTYKLRSADDGRYIKVMITAYGASSTAPVVTKRWIGPITAPTAGVITISGGARIASAASIVRGSKRATLANVRLVKHTSKMLRLRVTRVGKIATTTWAYVVKSGAMVYCTVARSLKHAVTLNVPLAKGESVKLVAVRT